MNTTVASLPNWRWEFDSPRPLQASSQVSDGAQASEQGDERGQVSPTLRPKSSDTPATELVWRQGWGWVERPVAS